MFSRRIRGILLLLAAPWALFAGRVFTLQTGESARSARASVDRSRVRESWIPPKRGSVRDRDGVLLAWDEVGFDLLVNPRDLGAVDWTCSACGRSTVVREEWSAAEGDAPPPRPPEPAPCSCGDAAARWTDRTPAVRASLSDLLEEERGVLAADLEALRAAAWKRARTRAAALPPRHRNAVMLEELGRLRKVRTDIPREAALEVYVHGAFHRGLVVDAEPVRRRAPDADPSVMELVGRTGPVHEEEVEELRRQGLSLSRIYRMGMGRSGVERSRDAELRGTYGRERELRDLGGSVTEREVVRPAVDGRDLVLTVSSRLCEEARNALGSRPGGVVMLDCHTGEILAMAGTSPEGFHGAVTACMPGSVMKPLTALVGLRDGTLPADGAVRCAGRDSRPIRCTHEHGAVGLEEALSGSCNAFFARAGMAAGPDSLAVLGRLLRIDLPYGIGVSLEGGGTDWSQSPPVGRPWDRNDGANLGIGQGPILMSPLHVAVLYAPIGNGGRPVTPTLVRGFGPPPGAPVLDPSDLRRVRAGLEGTVLDGGTADLASLRRHRVAGKTGTAQIRRGDPALNAWFAGYAPAEDPRVVVVVVVHEQAGSGGDVAAPIAARLLDAWERGAR